MRISGLICLFSVFVCLDAMAQEETVTPDRLTTTHPTSRMDEAWWRERHESRLNQMKSIEQLNILLIGDSITQGWETTGSRVWKDTFEDLTSFNLGFSGDRTEHVLWRLENGSVEGLDPGVVVILIGTNNTGQNLDKPRDIAKGVKAIINEVRNRMPKSPILLMAVFPYDKDSESPRRKNNNEINNLISQYHDGKTVHYLDICNSFFDESGQMSTKITPDFLHLSEAGYQIWADGIEQKVRELCRR